MNPLGDYVMETRTGVLFGVDYYPEQWDRRIWEDDARRMRDMGIRLVRIMEFAWVLLEPKAGQYDFSLFDAAVETLSRHGMTIVLGTPTATFPVWLYEKDPSMVQVHPSGVSRDFGARRQGCYNSKTYRRASEGVVTACAKHFGHNGSITGWQIDNEIGHEGSDRCVCRNCIAAWHRWLKEKYGSIKKLNDTWGTVFWGTTYSRFEQVPVPRAQVSTIQNPGLFLDYDRFCSDSAVKFVDAQIAILRKHIAKDQWISTNLYPAPHGPVIDMERMCGNMDLVGFDNYPVWGDQDEPLPYYFNSYILSYIRGLKKNANFTIFEQFSGFQGHRCLGYLPPDRQVVLWTNQSIAHGADRIFYFRWRTAPYGQEQLCYGIFDSDNTPTSRSEALAENMRVNEKNYSLFASTPCQAEACLVYEKDNSRVLKEQYLSKGLFMEPVPYMQVGYDAEMTRNYVPFTIFSVNADVKSVQGVELERYKLISLPLYQMADPQFIERLSRWVEKGGHLILGWRAGARDMNNHSIPMELPGLFSDMAGVRVKRFESLNQTKVKIRIGIFPAKGEVWAESIEPVTAKPFAWYRDGKKHYSGVPCATVNAWGKGLVYYFGTSPDPAGLFFFYRKILKRAGLSPKFYGMGIEAISRKTADGGMVRIILNHNPKAKIVKWRKIAGYGVRFDRE
jgi:beta-galactosidase